MPNWCINDIDISGPSEKIKELYEKMIEQNSIFDVLVPIGDWDYHKALDSWGTKWDANPVDLDLYDNGDYSCISGQIETAWGPPIQVFDTYLANNEDVSVEVKYFEPGMQIVGQFIDGHDDYHEYDSYTADNLSDHIPSELIDHFNLYSELALAYGDDDWEEYED